jgi:hypothetical protein
VESGHSADYDLNVTDAERPYLVCYDYGSGGLWWWIKAVSPEAITDTYRNVIVFEQTPAWWSEKNDRNTPHLALGEIAPGLERI